MSLRSGVLAAVALLIVVLFAFTVWPTPYRYYETSSQSVTVREHRLTGHLWFLSPYNGGWVPIEPRAVEQARQ